MKDNDIQPAGIKLFDSLAKVFLSSVHNRLGQLKPVLDGETRALRLE